MLVAPPYYPRPGEWERLAKAFPSDHNYVVVLSDQGIDSAATEEDARAKLTEHEGASIVEKLPAALGFMLMIWR